ncbi:MAG TPA: hypothetical protein VFV66_25450 [Nonomuraea sp.]|nr:hypothetical protein [Nonomuraea sp.]
MIAAVAAAFGVAWTFGLRAVMVNPVTGAGRAALKEAGERELTHSRRPGSQDLKLIALHGLTEFPDQRLAEPLRRDTRARSGRTASCCAPGHWRSYSGSFGGVLGGIGGGVGGSQAYYGDTAHGVGCGGGGGGGC